MEVYPLVNVNKKLWKDPPCYQWVNDNYFDWAIFYVAFLVGGFKHLDYFPFHIWDNPSH